jgi:uncharacterized membrane protein YesL
MFSSILAWLNGKKTIIGAVILAVTTIAAWIPGFLPFFGVGADHVVQIVGVATTVVGLLHKAYKYIFGEDVPATPPAPKV